MHRVPTQSRRGRGVSFAPLAQSDSEPIEPSADVSQRWENVTATEEFRSRIQNIFRYTAPVGVDDEDEDDGLRYARSRRSAPAYAPVENLIPNPRSEEADIAELAGAPIEYYAPYPRATSALSKASDTRTETTYLGSDPGDKYLLYAPRIVSVEVEEDDPSDRPGGLPTYKPFVLQRTFFSLLLLTVVALLALMVVAIRVLPDASQTLSADLITRNSSQTKARSPGSVPYGLLLPRGKGHNGTSEAPSATRSPSDATERSSSPSTTSTTSIAGTSTSSSTSTSTSTTTTSSSSAIVVPNEPSNSHAETEASSTTTTTSDTGHQKPSKGEETPSSSIVTGTTSIIASSTSTTTSTHNEPLPTQQDTSSTSSTRSDSQPAEGGHQTGGDKTRTGDGDHPPTDHSSTIIITSSTTSPGITSSTANDPGTTANKPSSTANEPTPTLNDTSYPASTPTTTTSTLQVTSIQGSEPVTSPSTSTAVENGGSPHSTTEIPLVTCTVDVTATHVQWITIPVLTVNLGLGVKRTARPIFSALPRQVKACDVTITASHMTTVLSTTAATTITTGIGGGQSISSTTPLGDTSVIPTQPSTTLLDTVAPSSGSSLSSINAGEPSTGGSAPPTAIGSASSNLPGQGESSTTYPYISETTKQSNNPTRTPFFTVTATTNSISGSSDSPGSTSPDVLPPGTYSTKTSLIDTNSAGGTPTDSSNVVTYTTASTVVGTSLSGGSPDDTTSTATYNTELSSTSAQMTYDSNTGSPAPSTTTTRTTTAADVSSPSDVQQGTTIIANATTVATSAPPQSAADQGAAATHSTISIFISSTHVAQKDPASEVGAQRVSYTNHHETPETHTSLPTPVTTVVHVVESTNVISSIVSTITPIANETDTHGVGALGAVFMTTVPVTSVMFVTRLKTQQVIHGIQTNSNDGVQETWVTVLTDNYGHPTSTLTQTKYGYLTTQTLTASGGFPTATVTNVVLKDPSTTAFIGSNGKTSTKTYYRELTTSTLTDNRGFPTTTQVLEITQTPTVVTEYDGAGHATRTVTKMVPDGTSTSTSVVMATTTNAPNASLADKAQFIPVPVSSGSYFIGLLLPTLLAIGVSIPIRILDQTAKLYQPFSAMTVAHGARTADSLCLETTGLWGMIHGFLSPLTGNWLLAVTGLLVLTSSTLVALSAESIQLAVQKSDCESSSNGTLPSCPSSLSISSGPAQASAGVICVIALLIGIAAWGLWRRRLGTYTSQPWSMLEISRLAKHDEILALLKKIDSRNSSVTREHAIMAFGDRRFFLDQWKDKTGWQYGVRIKNDAGGFDAKKTKYLCAREKVMPFFTLSLTGRVLFFLLSLALLLTILLYHNTGGAFQTFMDSEGFGGRFILTGAGVIISLIWWTFFICK